ncbi:oxidoreductase [Actinomycetota bacterium]|nr:oxidoreductase [Actinomycetota bacterium]
MADICVITGGGSGIGLAAAKRLGQDYYIVLVGRTPQKLEGALAELKALGIEGEILPGDVSNQESMQRLAGRAASLGKVKVVIHAAGMSPQMGNAETIFRTNALGTVYVNQELSKVMGEQSCIIDISSMAAYLMEEEQFPHDLYALSLTDTKEFVAKVLEGVTVLPEAYQSGLAYSISKHFAIWFAQHSAVIYGQRGIRVVSVSPGTFATPMGELEGDQAADIALNGALGRLGDPDEMAKLLAFVSSDAASYLTGTDILCDGGAVAAIRQD